MGPQDTEAVTCPSGQAVSSLPQAESRVEGSKPKAASLPQIKERLL